MAILVGHEGGVAQEQRLPAAVPPVRRQAHVPRHQPLVVRVARVPDEILVNGLTWVNRMPGSMYVERHWVKKHSIKSDREHKDAGFTHH